MMRLSVGVRECGSCLYLDKANYNVFRLQIRLSTQNNEVVGIIHFLTVWRSHLRRHWELCLSNPSDKVKCGTSCSAMRPEAGVT